MDNSEEVLAQETVEKITSDTKDLLDELRENWRNMYEVTPTMMDQRLKQFTGYVRDFYAEILESEERRKLEMEKELEGKLQERIDLQRELEVEIETELDDTMPMAKMLSWLDNAMKEYREVKTARVSKLNNLRNKERTLCDLLGISSLPPTKVVPSEDELEKLEVHIFTLNEEKVKRSETFRETRATIMNKWSLLEVEPVSHFERELASNHEENFKLTQENMARLKDVDSRLEKSFQQASKRAEELLDKLKNLWLRINEDERNVRQFLSQNKGVGESTIRTIKEEIARCEEIKLANMKTIIVEVRIELEAWWDKLNFTEEQRKKFHPFFTDLFTEDMLDLHEAELKKLQQFYNDNIPIFELLQKRNELWARMLHLDEAAMDKNRLFNNRGGQLLREEKERKRIETNLPKIDKQLQKLLLDFEEREGSPFFWNGHNLLIKIGTDWDERNAEKEMKKQVKKAEHAKMLEIEVKMGTRSAQKRKMPVTPKSNNVSGKVLKRATSSDLFTNSLTSAGNRTLTLSKDPGSLRRKLEPDAFPTCFAISRSRHGTPIAPKIVDTSVASYTHFQEDIKEKSQELSVPRRRLALKEINSPIVAHSSPTASPPSEKRLRTPIPSRKHVSTPRSELRKKTPRSAGKLTPRTLPRLTPARTHFPINI